MSAPFVALHFFGLAFLWSVLTCVLCGAAVLVIDYFPDPERIDVAVDRTFTAALCGMIVSGAGTITCAAWVGMTMLFGG
jgi:hypothetical protein